MLDRVVAIALNTYRESLRARILLGLAGVAFAVAFYSIVVGLVHARATRRASSATSGWASISIFGIAVAIVIGATSLHRELEQKTLFPILARPIRRGEYLVGKYLGTLLTIAVFVMADAGLVLLIGAALGRAAARRPVARRRARARCSASRVAMWRVALGAHLRADPLGGAGARGGRGALRRRAGGAARGARRQRARASSRCASSPRSGMLFSSFSTPFLSALPHAGDRRHRAQRRHRSAQLPVQVLRPGHPRRGRRALEGGAQPPRLRAAAAAAHAARRRASRSASYLAMAAVAARSRGRWGCSRWPASSSRSATSL